MSLAPHDLFPQLADWVGTLGDVWPGRAVKPYFAQWEVGHILSLIVLGGSSIILNLRLIGFGLTDETPREVYRNIRTWMHAGVVGIILTGLLIGASNAERLYTSEAFTAKMLALAAALILTYGVSLPVARADGRAGLAASIAGGAGLAVWALSIWVFASGKLINPGLWHVLTAGALIVILVTRGRTRIVYAVGLAGLVAAQFVTTHFVIPPDDYARLDPANKAFAWAFAAWIAGAIGVQVSSGRRGEPGGPFTKGMAYAAILVWVTAAAAGRWIAFA